LIGRHGAMKPGGSVREVSDMGPMGIGAGRVVVKYGASCPQRAHLA
jgi:hypothetical protein